MPHAPRTARFRAKDGAFDEIGFILIHHRCQTL
jgi:hypothetical protein